ncbi:MAG: hypothetical protein QNJ16_12090, partial [Rhodobacter sp.]|nr:hypothetical protein [Rhodobacter sp.]
MLDTFAMWEIGADRLWTTSQRPLVQSILLLLSTDLSDLNHCFSYTNSIWWNVGGAHRVQFFGWENTGEHPV